MKKLFLILALLFGSAPSCFAAGNVFVNSVEKGQYTDINVVNACGQTARTGLKAIIDQGCATQASTSSTVAANTLIQASTADGAAAAGFAGTPPVQAITCTQDTSGRSTCADYTTTTATKSGSIAVTVNGAVQFLRLYNGPQ